MQRRIMENDHDIQHMDRQQLKAEIVRLRKGIRQYRDRERPNSWVDEHGLLELLPETERRPHLDLSKQELFCF